MTYLLIALACGVLNRMRGDDRWMPAWLPGRALWYVAPAVGAVALLIQPWQVALAFAAGYLLWAVWSWGYLLAAVGGVTPAREPSVLETALLRLPGATLPVFARMLFVTPCIAAVVILTGNVTYWLAAPAFALAASGIYRLLFRPLGSHDWLRAELAIGTLWGLLILAA